MAGSGLDLEWFIKKYIPKGWDTQLREVCHCPRFMTEYEWVRKAWKTDNLEYILSLWQNGIYRKWYFIEAIDAYFRSIGETKD